MGCQQVVIVKKIKNDEEEEDNSTCFLSYELKSYTAFAVFVNGISLNCEVI